MGQNYDKIHAWQNRAAGQVDRAIAREKKLKAEGRWNVPQEKPILDPEAFSTKYPNFVAWERALEERATSIDRILRELRDYADMNTKPQEAYNWLKKLYAEETEIRDAWAIIKEKLHW